MSTIWYGYFEFECLDKDGNVKWREEGKNALANEGQLLVLDTFFRSNATSTAPTQFYLRLYNATPTKTSSLSALTGEPTTNGYAPQLVERSSIGFPTLALDVGDYMVSSKQVTFSATGGSWGAVTTCVLSTSADNSGKLIAYKSLSQSRTLADGETLKVTYKEKLMPSS